MRKKSRRAFAIAAASLFPVSLIATYFILTGMAGFYPSYTLRTVLMAVDFFALCAFVAVAAVALDRRLTARR